MTATSTPRGRFDDLVSGTAFEFDKVVRELVAWHPRDVNPVLDLAQQLSDEDYWAFGFVAYEAARGLDPDLVTAQPNPHLPLVWFGISAGPRQVPPVEPNLVPELEPEPWTPMWDEQRHRLGLDSVHQHIAAGETYQCNLTTKLTQRIRMEPFHLYRALASGQRGKYNAWLDIGRHIVASASPELFFEFDGSRIAMRPMKGTAPRGRTTTEDASLVDELTASTKEQAENVMIVDMVRNDLGRIARVGSVRVPTLLRVERYETVHQLTSDVTAELAPEVAMSEIFRALFPCGSITGAPKGRTMELIAELEDGPRGIYCGAIGLIAPAGAAFRARFAVAIRTAVIDRETDVGSYGSGGGIKWDSRPHDEYAELLTKTHVLNSRPLNFHLIETMRHVGCGVIKSIDAHMSRAEDSARYFGFDFDSERVRSALIARTTGSSTESRIRLLLYRNGRFEIDVSAVPDAVADSRVLRLALHPDAMSTTTCWSRHKTSRRDPYDRRRESMPNVDDVILTNEYGEVMETCTGNLAVLIDGVWLTPPLDSGCLPGIERRTLIENATLREDTLTASRLRTAVSIAVINSLRGWRPAVLVDAAATVADRVPA